MKRVADLLLILMFAITARDAVAVTISEIINDQRSNVRSSITRRVAVQNRWFFTTQEHR